MIEMNEDVRTEWVAALRSGEYEQGRGHLRLGQNYCCLGVLCDLAVKHGVIGEPVGDDGSLYIYDGSSSLLPKRVMTWAGLDEFGSSAEGEIMVGGESYGELSSANDAGRTFAEIADAIAETTGNA